MSGNLVVFHAETGKKLKEIFVGTAVMAAPMSYAIDGEQYIAVMAGYGGAVLPFPDEQAAIRKYKNIGRIIVFKLNGTDVPLPPLQQRDTVVPEPPMITLNPGLAEKGKLHFNALCSGCHSVFGNNHYSDIPDLTMMSAATHASFNDIVLKGKLSYYGMASFADVLKPEDAEAIHHYLISLQQERYMAARK